MLRSPTEPLVCKLRHLGLWLWAGPLQTSQALGALRLGLAWELTKR